MNPSRSVFLVHDRLEKYSVDMLGSRNGRGTVQARYILGATEWRCRLYKKKLRENVLSLGDPDVNVRIATKLERKVVESVVAYKVEDVSMAARIDVHEEEH